MPICGADSCLDPSFNFCAQIDDIVSFYAGKQTNGYCAQRNQEYTSIQMCASQHCIKSYTYSYQSNGQQHSYVTYSCIKLMSYSYVGYDHNYYCLSYGQANAIKCLKDQFCLDQKSNSCMYLSSNILDSRFARQVNTDFCLSQQVATLIGDQIEECVRGYCVYTDPITNFQTCKEVGIKYQYCADQEGKCTFIYTNLCSYCPDGYCQFSDNQGYCLYGKELIQKLGEKNCAIKVNNNGLCQILNINSQKYFKYDVCTDINGFCQNIYDRTKLCQQCPNIYRNPGNQTCYSIEQTQQFLQLKLVFNMNLDYMQDDCYDQNNCLSNQSLKCPYGCFSCNSQFNCTQCQKGFFMYKNTLNNYNQCVLCPQINYYYQKCIDCSSELDLWNQNQQFKTCRNFETNNYQNRLQQMNNQALSYIVNYNGNNISVYNFWNCPTNCISCQMQGINNAICLSCQQGFVLESSNCVPCPNNCTKCEFAIFVSGKKALLKSSLSQKQLSSGQYANVVWTLICLQCPNMQLVRYDLLGCEVCGQNCFQCVYKNIYGIINDQQNNLVQMTQQDIINLGYKKVCQSCYQGIVDGSGQNCTQYQIIPYCQSQTFLINDSIQLNIYPLYYLDNQVTKFQLICTLCGNGYLQTADKQNCNLSNNQINYCGSNVFDQDSNACLNQECRNMIYNCYACYSYKTTWNSNIIQIYQCTFCQWGYIPTLKGCLPCPEGCAYCYEGSKFYKYTEDLAQMKYKFSYQDRLDYRFGAQQQILCTSCQSGYFLDANTQQCIKLICGKYCKYCQFDYQNNRPYCSSCDTNALSNLIKDQQYWIARLYFNQNQLPDINQLIKITGDGTDCMICPILCSTCFNVGDISKNPYFLYQSQCMSCKDNLNGFSSNLNDYQIAYDKSKRKCYLCNNKNQGCHYQKQKVIYAQCSNIGKPLGDGSLQNPINFNRLQDINIDKIILNELPYDQLIVYYNELQINLRDNLNLQFMYITNTYNINIDTLDYAQTDEQYISQVSSKQTTSMSFLHISSDLSSEISIKDVQYQLANLQSTISFASLQQISAFLNIKALISSVQIENAVFSDISPFLIAPLFNIFSQTTIFKLISVNFNKFDLQNIKQNNSYKLGGAAYIQSVTTQIISSNITNCQAIQGAGIYLVIVDFGNVQIKQSNFVNNISYLDNNFELQGGAIYFDGKQSYGFDISIQQTNFTNNFASFRGGAVYLITPFQYGCSLSILNSKFINNLSLQGSQIFVQGNLQDKTKLEINNIQLLNYISQLFQQMTFLKALILKNKQYQYYVSSNIQVSNIQYFQLEQSNLSIISDPSNLINIEQLIFQNILQVDGLKKFDCFLTTFENSIYKISLISLNNINQTQFQYVTIQNNTNYYDYLITKQNKTFQNTNLLQIFSNSVSVSHSNFTNNTCSVCQNGNILINSVKIHLSLNYFQKNIALNGGALYISNQIGVFQNTLNGNNSRILQQINSNKTNSFIFDSYTIISKCSFEENQSVLSGGAIYLQNFPVIIQTSKFIQNNAQLNGGAIFSQDEQNSYLESINCLYQQNTALNGGAVYSVQGNSLQSQKTNTFIQNKASVLNNDIFVSPTQMMITINKVLHDNKKPKIQISDHISGYMEEEILISLANNEGDVYQNIDQPEVLQIQKISGQGYISPNTLSQINGIYNLTKQVNIYGNFGQNLTLKIYSDSIKVPNFDRLTGQVTYTRGFSVTLQINMIQKCPVGYVSKKNILNYDVCIMCKGSYSFDPDSQVCTPCPVQKAICYGSFIQLPQGYWRSSSNSSLYYECESDFIKCIGDNSTLFKQVSQYKLKDSYEVYYCNRGYVGALCGDCDINQAFWDSKFYKSSYNSCKQCRNNLAISMPNRFLLLKYQKYFLQKLYQADNKVKSIKLNQF
ncbi:transmembrane protein, putative (macronuclear) [Tetrahymena thermophila SB210]|uniref:Transmembrane protein, putative n=1 Tax=Tetrahymena thermophila (strain SB210) TaxID=312017 RepID=W7X5L4_TETTS|nr:transmembrane protein, putative [Tetrahymena thermophila SB210]EWS72687.1 transmembrane protein, putative [Tetrahymena thermophila SB210]|eukprot:XP_012654763.1 transmembrane protein, putative [Tetrahymena thermophila SB210]